MSESEAIKIAKELFGDKHKWTSAVGLMENSYRGNEEVWLVGTSHGNSGAYALVDSIGGDLLLLAERKSRIS